ncbi:MAG: T9SS C-terminal target domain-containing protein [Chitinophagia bacterium]|nr:T9SS C-terminal target domain-containing protein [Chitinophagia bacterium]
MAVLGVMAQFTGKISPTSTKKVNFKVWNSTGTLPIHSKLAYNGLPDRCIATKTVAITNIGIRPGGDTLKAFLLDSPTYKLGNSFFVGYDIDYNFAALNGDTISVMGNANGKRRTPKYTIEVVVNDFGDTLRDTIINVQNATQWSDSVWHDNYYDNLRLYHHYALFPIVAVHSPSALPQVYTQGVGFGGAFPNPCNEQITIIFSTSACSKTTLQIFDINGKLLKTEELTSLDNTPQHISLSTTSYPAGKYLIYLSTAEGKGIGSIFEVGH